eukprot:11479023-Ditylum_brightwellii.AAC.1
MLGKEGVKGFNIKVLLGRRGDMKSSVMFLSGTGSMLLVNTILLCNTGGVASTPVVLVKVTVIMGVSKVGLRVVATDKQQSAAIQVKYLGLKKNKKNERD